jgi:hypothetical protein
MSQSEDRAKNVEDALARVADGIDEVVRNLGLQPSRRRRGRPSSWSRTEILATYRALAAELGRRPTQRELAANLEPPGSDRALRDHLARFRLSWPID